MVASQNSAVLKPGNLSQLLFLAITSSSVIMAQRETSNDRLNVKLVVLVILY